MTDEVLRLRPIAALTRERNRGFDSGLLPSGESCANRTFDIVRTPAQAHPLWAAAAEAVTRAW
jgi:hypothetical protein